jgi:transposase
MRKIHTVLRLHFEAGLSRREIAKSQSISYGTVANYLRRAQSAGLSWPLQISAHELTTALFPERGTANAQQRFAEPDYPRIHQELKSVGMTKQLAWEEYRQFHPDDGYSYSQFCHRYLEWLNRQQRSMRQTCVFRRR